MLLGRNAVEGNMSFFHHSFNFTSDTQLVEVIKVETVCILFHAFKITTNDVTWGGGFQGFSCSVSSILSNTNLLQIVGLRLRVLPAPGRSDHLPGVLPPEELQEGRPAPA